MTQEQSVQNVEVILTQMATLKDGGVKMVFETNEISSDDAVKVLQMRNKFVYLSFSANPQRVSN